MTVVDSPPDLTYGTVVGRWIQMIGDSSDPDAIVDPVPMTGMVIIRCEADYLIDTSADPPASIVPAPIRCTLDDDGYLRDPAGNVGVTLLATDSQVNPVDFTYQVTLAFAGGPARVFSIYVPGGETVDLATVTPLFSSSGTVIVPGPKGDKGDQGDQGIQGPEGSTPDAAVAAHVTNPNSATSDALEARYDRLSRADVRGWGAVGDGVANDSSAFVNSLAFAVGSPEKTWYIPRGTYAMPSFPDVPSGVNVEAEPGALVKITGAVTYFQDFSNKTKQVWKNLSVDLNGKPTSSGFRFGSGAVGLRFEDINVTSSAPMAANVHAVRAETGSYNINWRRGRISSLWNPVSVFGNATRITFREVEIVGYGNRGIFINANSTDPNQAGCLDVWIKDCIITDPGWFRTVVTKEITGGGTVGKLTLAPSDSGEATNPYVVGQITDIRGVGAPFDGTDLTVTAVTSTTVTFAVSGVDTAPTAVVQSGNFPPCVQMRGDPRQPIAIQNANFSGTVPLPGTNNPLFRHRGLRVEGCLVRGVKGVAHHLTLTGDPEAGALLGGTADAISCHGCYNPIIDDNQVIDSGEVAITVANFTMLARVSNNKLTRANTNGICFQNVLQCSGTDNEVVDCGGDYGASGAPRTGSHTAIWCKDSPESFFAANRLFDTLSGVGGTAIQTTAFYIAGTNNAGTEIGFNPVGGGTTVLVNPSSTSTGKVGLRWTLPPRTVEAAADQSSPASDTTIQLDNELLLTFEPYGVYDIDGSNVKFSATTAGDASFGWDTVPSDTTLEWGTDGPGTTAASAGAAVVNKQVLGKTSVATVGGGGAGDVWCYTKGRLKAGATGGTLRVKFGQFVADATPVKRLAGSKLKMQRVG